MSLITGVAVVACPPRAETQDDATPHSDARLVAEVASIRPGSPFSVALHVRLDPGWHTYWRNPGDSGSEALIEWALPEGWSTSEIHWPAPERLPAPPLMSYAYEDEVLLIVEISPPEGLAPGRTATLAGSAEFLVCREICLPARADLELVLPVVAERPAPDPSWARVFHRARERLPLIDTEWSAGAIDDGDAYRLTISPPPDWAADLEGAYFFPGDPTAVEHTPRQTFARRDGEVHLSLTKSAYNTGPRSLEGVLVLPAGASFDDAGLRRSLALEAPVQVAAALPPGAASGLSLGAALAFAFLGGALLNLMPCVFPILSLKAMGFVRHGSENPLQARLHGLAFGGGVIFSFLVIAAVLMAIRATGTQVGWGFQLQSPSIVAVLAALLFVVGLAFLGVAEIGTALTRLGGAGGDESVRGSVMTGVLATVVATPCTAPFMGAAIGAALVRPPAEGLTVFAGLGVGMATPYVALSFWPPLIRRLPKPGRWMETLRQALAFPMFAVVVWLLWVFGLQTGVSGATWLLASLTLLAFGGWLVGRWPAEQISLKAYVLIRGLAVAVVATAVMSAVRGVRSAPADGSSLASTGTPVWTEYSQALVRDRRAEGRVVFVDFTAAWCISCQVNERVVLASGEVRDAFRDRDVALLKADWTRRDDRITRALASFGRSGVPLYVVYSPDLRAQPELLPAILTPGIVLGALERAASPLAGASVQGTVYSEVDPS